MADDGETLANLKVELDDVKLQIREIKSIAYASRSVEDKKTYTLLLQEKMRLNDKIDALEGLCLLSQNC